MEPLLIFQVVLSLVVLITYFLIANNISQIRKTITADEQTFDYWIKVYRKNLAWHKKTEALNALQEAIWAAYRNGWFSEETYQELKEKWEPTIIALGGEFIIKQKKPIADTYI